MNENQLLVNDVLVTDEQKRKTIKQKKLKTIMLEWIWNGAKASQRREN